MKVKDFFIKGNLIKVRKFIIYIFNILKWD